MTNPLITVDGDNVLSSDGLQLIAADTPIHLPALSGIARSGASRCGASGRGGFIFIDGIERTNDIDWRSFSWIDRTGSQPGELRFNLKHDGDILPPRPDSVVILSVGTVENIKFKGNVSVLKVSNSHPTGAVSSRRYGVTVTDTRRDVNRRRVTGVFVGPADEVVREIISTFAPGFNVDNVQLGAPVVGEMSFKYSTLIDSLDRIAERVNWFWHMTENDVHFYEFTSNAAQPAKPINEDGWGWYLSPPLTATLDITQQRNRIFVEGRGSELAESVAPGQTIVPVVADDNFRAILELDIQGGYLNGRTLLETTNLDTWTQVGAPTVTAIPAPINEGPNSPAILLVGSDAAFIEESFIDHVDGPGLFSMMIRLAPLEPNTGICRVVVRDETTSTTLLDAVIDITNPQEPTEVATVGQIHRNAVRFTELEFEDGWFWFVLETGFDMVASNDVRIQIYAAQPGDPTSGIQIWGVMAQNENEQKTFSWHIPVDFIFLPEVGGQAALRTRETAYLENELIAYRAAFDDDIALENQCLFSHRLGEWIETVRAELILNIDTDTDGNATLDQIQFDGTGGDANPHTIGVDSILATVSEEGGEDFTPGYFSLRCDITKPPIGVPTGFLRIGFFDPSTGATLLTATNRIFAIFDTDLSEVVEKGTGSGNVGETVLSQSTSEGGGLNQVEVTGQLGGGWAYGDDVACGLYLTNAAFDDEITPDTDGEAMVSGRVQIARKFDGTQVNLASRVIETGAEPVIILAHVEALFGVPGIGQYLSITRRHGRGEDINPILILEDQAAQLLRSEIIAGPAIPPDTEPPPPLWSQDGPAEFYKRDRRLSAEGILAAAQLELIRWLAGPSFDNAIPIVTYTTRDQAAAIGALVLIDVPIGWGFSIEGTIVSVSTIFLKDGIQERTVEVALVTPRTFFTYLAQVKRFTVEEI